MKNIFSFPIFPNLVTYLQSGLPSSTSEIAGLLAAEDLFAIVLSYKQDKRNHTKFTFIGQQINSLKYSM